MDLIGVRVEGDEAGLEGGGVAEGFAAADEPVDEPVVVGAAVDAGDGDGGVGGEGGEGGWVGGEVDDEWGGDAVGEFGEDDAVLGGDVDGGFVDGGSEFEHEFVGWSAAEDSAAAFRVEDDEAGGADERERGVVRDGGRGEVIAWVGEAAAPDWTFEWVGHHRGVFVDAYYAGGETAAGSRQRGNDSLLGGGDTGDPGYYDPVWGKHCV